jgi:outer membrane protein assembly factor BamA
LAARVQAGWVKPLNQDAGEGPLGRGSQLHPTKRFYAGGARSVRGYGENQLGPRILTIGRDALLEAPDDETAAACTIEQIGTAMCDPNAIPSSEFTPRPVGGTRVIQAGIEFRRPILGPLVGAIFIDGARVWDPALDEIVQARSAITPGFGVRYRSPIGPVRVDLGFRSPEVEELSVITETTEGERRLIRLETQKRFDPAEGKSGFLSSITNRLTLHLSIGESF